MPLFQLLLLVIELSILLFHYFQMHYYELLLFLPIQYLSNLLLHKMHNYQHF